MCGNKSQLLHKLSGWLRCGIWFTFSLSTIIILWNILISLTLTVILIITHFMILFMTMITNITFPPFVTSFFRCCTDKEYCTTRTAAIYKGYTVFIIIIIIMLNMATTMMVMLVMLITIITLLHRTQKRVVCDQLETFHLSLISILGHCPHLTF